MKVTLTEDCYFPQYGFAGKAGQTIDVPEEIQYDEDGNVTGEITVVTDVVSTDSKKNEVSDNGGVSQE